MSLMQAFTFHLFPLADRQQGLGSWSTVEPQFGRRHGLNYVEDRPPVTPVEL